jgi:hypothetical protein
MRDSELSDVSIPGSVLAEDRENSVWGGLCGALVFYRQVVGESAFYGFDDGVGVTEAR